MYNTDSSSNNPDRIVLHAPKAALDDLRERLLRTRWPDEVDNVDWAYGTNGTYLRELASDWARFDWREQEARLNRLPHFRSGQEHAKLHYVHVRSAQADALPLLVLHGWPGSFLQMLELLPMLADPVAHGHPDAQAFHVVAASLPGFGYSDASARPGQNMEAIADMMHDLMTRVLGYARYGARGSDLGGTVIDQLCRRHPDAIIGAHLTQLIVPVALPPPDGASEAEREFLTRSGVVANTELAYARLHASKPQTLAYAMVDSPVGMAGWIIEKYRSWGDTGGNIESRFSREFLLATLTLYWLTGSMAPAMRTYYEMVRNRGSTARIEVPTAFLMSPRDLFPAAPREWAERSHNVVRFGTAPRGGHFLECEEPALVAADLQEFFGELSRETTV